MIVWLSVAFAGITTTDATPCSGPVHVPGTRFELRVHTELLMDGQIVRQRTGHETWDLNDETPWPDALQNLSVGCRRELTIPVENASAAGLTAENPGASARMVLDVEAVTIPERKPSEAPREAPTIIENPSGLGYFDFKVGKGARPEAGQQAVVEYTLWLDDGSLIDTSYKRAEAFSYTVARGQVIPGWEEGVRGMRVGGERQLRVPWKLGYGRKGSPPTIPEKADLIFEVKLLRVE